MARTHKGGGSLQAEESNTLDILDIDSSRGISPAPSRLSQPSTNTTSRHVRVSEQRLSTLHATAGQLAFAPATQRTTVVTTTTTTVSLAPFVLQPPKSLRQRDPKVFPLAASPTPQHLRNISFEVDGSQATFTEAEDADDFLGQHDTQQRLLEQSDGRLREYEESHDWDGAKRRNMGNISSQVAMGSYFGNRLALPPSLAEAAEIAGSQRRIGKRRSQLSQQHLLDDGEEELLGQRAIAHLDERTSPVTPDAETGLARRLQSPVTSQELQLHTSHAARTGQDTRRTRTRRQVRGEQDDESVTAASLAAATPPVMDSDVEAGLPRAAANNGHPVLPSLRNTAPQPQDASLPSPSLSPVTAAANLAQRQQILARLQSDIDDVSDMSALDTEGPPKRKTPPLFNAQVAKVTDDNALESPDDSTEETSPRTIMDVPDMIAMFDGLPSELQSYVLFQLLKRSSRKTIRSVADVVNPALKCDPFESLPAELSLKITKFLDGQSLGRAAQVSKKWRHMINSDETAWRDLLDAEGFVLPDGEIERAIQEGWAWQFPRQNEYEKDLSHRSRRSSRTVEKLESSHSKPIHSEEEATAALRNSRKRKAAAPVAPSKRQKRKMSTLHEEDIRWLRELQKGQGPIACASAAARFVSDPRIGLRSLKSLHLFKSIYQRHLMIRNTWMDDSAQPHHLAFRAHHRHVVTCLLFDSDRIITGSDDTSINIFETKTGILRKRLEGHEGGVWALSVDGNTLVSGSTDRSVRIWDIESGTCKHTFQGHTSTVRCLVILQPTEVGKDTDGNPIIHPNEPIVITGSRDSTLRVWKMPHPDDAPFHQAGPPENESDNPYALRTLSGHHNSVRAIAAHGDTLISGSYDCSVRVWRISTGELTWRLQGHTQKVYSVVLDHERKRCISGSMDNLVKVWSLETGQCLFNLEGHTSLVGLLELNHGNLVSAAADSTLRVWDPVSGSCKTLLSAHTGAITCFQHDGRKVISGSDRTLKMWNIETGECIRDLLVDLSGVWQVRFDERRCVAAVQRNSLTYIEVLDFGASRDGAHKSDLGRRIVVDSKGREVADDESRVSVEAAGPADAGLQDPRQAV